MTPREPPMWISPRHPDRDRLMSLRRRLPRHAEMPEPSLGRAQRPPQDLRELPIRVPGSAEPAEDDDPGRVDLPGVERAGAARDADPEGADAPVVGRRFELHVPLPGAAPDIRSVPVGYHHVA